MGTTRTSTGTEVQGATCNDLLNRVEAGELSRVEATKRGRVVAVVVAPPASVAAGEGLHGFLRGVVQMPLGLHLTAPVLNEAFRPEAEELAEQRVELNLLDQLPLRPDRVEGLQQQGPQQALRLDPFLSEQRIERAERCREARRRGIHNASDHP